MTKNQRRFKIDFNSSRRRIDLIKNYNHCFNNQKLNN